MRGRVHCMLRYPTIGSKASHVPLSSTLEETNVGSSSSPPTTTTELQLKPKERCHQGVVIVVSSSLVFDCVRGLSKKRSNRGVMGEQQPRRQRQHRPRVTTMMTSGSIRLTREWADRAIIWRTVETPDSGELRARVDALLEAKRRAARRKTTTGRRRTGATGDCYDEHCGGDDEDDDGDDKDDDDDGDLDYDFLSYELEYLSVYGCRCSADMAGNDDDEGPRSSPSLLGGYNLDNDLLIKHAQHLSRHHRQLRREDDGDNDDNGDNDNHRSGGGGGAFAAPPSASPTSRNSYASFLRAPLHGLTERDATSALGVPGGRAEVARILLDGVHAREALMRGHVKLVMSVAKGWMRRGYSVAGANGEGQPGGGVGRVQDRSRGGTSHGCTTGRETGRRLTRPCRRGCSASRGRWTSTTPSAACGSRRTQRTG
jgi:hypothetical protein